MKQNLNIKEKTLVQGYASYQSKTKDSNYKLNIIICTIDNREGGEIGNGCTYI